MEKTRKKIKLQIRPRKYNDLLLIGVLIVLLLAMEIMLFYYNGITSFNVLGIINDIAVYFWILMMLNLIKSARLKKMLLGVVFIFFTLLFVIDAVYFKLFNNFSSVSSLSSARNVFKQDLSLIGFAASAVFIAVFAAIGIFLLCIIKLPENRRKSFFKFTLPIVMSVAIVISGANITTAALMKSRTFDNSFDYYASNKYLYDSLYSGKKYASTFGYLNFRIKDLVLSSSTAKKHAIEDISLLFQDRETKQTNALTGKLQDQNVITIMAETFDTRVIDPVLTPNLYEFMSDSFVFDNYYVPTFFEGATINSEFMSHIGMLPVTSTWANNFGDKYYNNYFGDYSLAAQMEKGGYETYYFHNYIREFYHRELMIPNWGFKNMGFAEDLVELGYQDYIKDTSLLGFFEGDIVDFDSKFYIHITTYSMHAGNDNDYAANLDFVKNNFAGISDKTAIYYAKAMEFDAFVGQLVAVLGEKGVLDNTAIVIYPDHYNYVTKEIYRDLDVDVESKEVHHQKLMLRVFGQTADEIETILGGREISFVGSTLDIAPTILNLAAPNSVYKYFIGGDIFDENCMVFFEDFCISNGRSTLNIDNYLTGEESDREQLRLAMEEKINFRNISPVIYDMDYFRQLNSAQQQESEHL